MHVPPLNPSQDRLSDWPACAIEVRCGCERVLLIPVPLLIAQSGDRTIRRAVDALRCDRCKGRPSRVWVVAGMHRECRGGPSVLDWAVEVRV